MQESDSSAGSTAISTERSMAVAAWLTLSGGFLDAFTYVGHGQVFANAMTGNIVLLGVSAALGDWAQAIHHVPPLLAFVAGVFIAQYLRIKRFNWRINNPALLCLGLEIIFLLAGAWLPNSFPDIWLVPGIALVAAMQNSSFTHLESSPYNSVMITGNLRRSVEAILISRRDTEAWHQARLFGSICLFFLVGAIVGTVTTERLQNMALLIPVLMLAIAFIQCWRGPIKFP